MGVLAPIDVLDGWPEQTGRSHDRSSSRYVDRRDRGRGAHAGAGRGAINRRHRATDAMGTSGPAGHLEQRHAHAVRTSRTAGGPGVPDRRGSGQPGAADGRPQQPPVDGARATGRGRRQRRRLQQLLDGTRHLGRRDPAHVHGHGSAERPVAGPDPGGGGQTHLSGGAAARSGAGRRPAGRYLGAARPRRPVSVVPGNPVVSDRLQQQLPHRADTRHGRHPAGAHPRRALHSAGWPPAYPAGHTPVRRGLARSLGGRHACRRDHPLQRQGVHSELQRQPE